ncbi:hypothetical protein CRUP_029146, partial [Coryphaenoides rupestris]
GGPLGPGPAAACSCQLRLLTSDPGYSPRLLLRTLLQGDCHLPRTLLEHSPRKPFCSTAVKRPVKPMYARVKSPAQTHGPRRRHGEARGVTWPVALFTKRSFIRS